MTAPTKINSGNGRTVSRTDVLKADDPAVEREQLNRILKSLDARLYLAEQAIDEVEASSSSSSDENVDLSNLSVDTTQLDYQPIGGDAYYLNIAAGGVGTLELADEAVTTAKIDDEAVTTAKIDDDAVTFAKMQNIATDRLIGRDTAASGSPEEIAVGGGLEFTGSAGIQRSALTGDVTAPAGDNATTLATVNANVGTFGAASETLSLTLDGKGRVTAASSQAIAIAYTQVSGLGTVVTYDIGTSGGTVPLCNTSITWAGPQTIGGSVSPLLTIDRAAITNSIIEYKTTSGSVFAGQGVANEFNIDGDNNAAASPWFRCNSGGIQGTPIGATTPSTGAFTTLSASSTITAGGDIIGSATNLIIRRNTSDGSDSGAGFLCGGGSASSTRGGIAAVYGNEHASRAGDVRLICGDAAGAAITLEDNTATTVVAVTAGLCAITGSLSATTQVTSGGTIKGGSATVATLAAGSINMRSFVTDATATLAAGIGTVVAGGGANAVPVVHDGTNWRIG